MPARARSVAMRAAVRGSALAEVGEAAGAPDHERGLREDPLEALGLRGGAHDGDDARLVPPQEMG
jgi:hypothetical protein